MAKTLGRDGMIGSVVLEGLAYEFRSRTDAEDALVKWTDSDGTTQAKLTGDGQLKLYNAPVAAEDVGAAGYTATFYLPLEGGTVTGPIDMSGQKLVNVGAATADTDVLTRTAADTRFLKQSDAATTYLTQAAATATYLSQASAATNYAPASGSTVYASKTELGNYYTTTQAQQQFAPISGSQAYAPITGSSNYASTSSLNNYAPKASPSFTGTVTSAGTVDAPVVKADYIASPALPLSGTHGFLFDAGVNPSGGIAQSPTTIYLVAPNQTGAAVSCVKNVAGALTYVPVNVAEPTASPAAVTLNYFNTHAANSSDARLKEAIAPIDNGTALNKLLDLTPVSYTYRPDGSASLGLIANAVADVVPEAVREMEGFENYVQEGEPKIRGVVPMALVALLIGAVKELTARVEALEAKV